MRGAGERSARKRVTAPRCEAVTRKTTWLPRRMLPMIGPRKAGKSPHLACCVCCRHSKREARTRCASWAARWQPKDEVSSSLVARRNVMRGQSPRWKSACACDGRTTTAPPKRHEKIAQGAVQGGRIRCTCRKRFAGKVPGLRSRIRLEADRRSMRQGRRNAATLAQQFSSDQSGGRTWFLTMPISWSFEARQRLPHGYLIPCHRPE